MAAVGGIVPIVKLDASQVPAAPRTHSVLAQHGRREKGFLPRGSVFEFCFHNVWCT